MTNKRTCQFYLLNPAQDTCYVKSICKNNFIECCLSFFTPRSHTASSQDNGIEVSQQALENVLISRYMYVIWLCAGSIKKRCH